MLGEAQKSIVLTEKRETFMQTMSTYVQNLETKFNWFLFETVLNLNSDDHLKDSYLVFRK